MKKLILIFIALSFFSVCFAGSIQDMHKAAIARKNAAPTTVFDENFDNCDTGTGMGNCNETWSTNANFTVTAAEGPDASQALIYAGAIPDLASAGHTLGAVDATITFDFKIDSGNEGDDLVFITKDAGGDDGIQVYLEYEAAGVKVRTYGHTEGFVEICASEDIAEWYTVTIDNIDWSGRTYDIDVSIKDGASQGTPCVDCEMVENDSDDIDAIILNGSTANVMDLRLDNILITVP